MSIAELRVVVTSAVGVDAASGEDEHGPVLYLRPGQSFGCAVRAVRAALPNVHADEARQIVRRHLPGALPSVADSPDPRPEARVVAEARARRLSLLTRAGMTAVVALAVTGAFLTGYATQRDAGGHLRTPAGLTPFEGPLFDAFAAEGASCVESGPMRARCVDIDGLTMTAEVAAGPDYLLYTLSYGDNRLVVREYTTPVAARMWVQQRGVASMSPNLLIGGRFVAYGSDRARLDRYGQVAEKELGLTVYTAADCGESFSCLPSGSSLLPTPPTYAPPPRPTAPPHGGEKAPPAQSRTPPPGAPTQVVPLPQHGAALGVKPDVPHRPSLPQTHPSSPAQEPEPVPTDPGPTSPPAQQPNPPQEEPPAGQPQNGLTRLTRDTVDKAGETVTGTVDDTLGLVGGLLAPHA